MELLLPTPPSLPCSIPSSPIGPDGTSSHPPLSSAHPSHPPRWRVFPPSESDLDTLPFTEILPQGKYVQELCWIIISTSPQPWPHHPSPSKRHQLASPAQCAPPLLHPLNPPRSDSQSEHQHQPQLQSKEASTSLPPSLSPRPSQHSYGGWVERFPIGLQKSGLGNLARGWVGGLVSKKRDR